MSEKIKISKEGLEDIQKELRKLLDVEQPAILEQLENARAMGDLSENADYKAAKDKQGEIENRIRQLQEIIRNAEVIKEKKGKKINILNFVTFKDLSTGQIQEVKIVSSIEADPLTDPAHMKVSNECPLGLALIGKEVGNTVTVKADTPYEIVILEVK